MIRHFIKLKPSHSIPELFNICMYIHTLIHTQCSMAFMHGNSQLWVKYSEVRSLRSWEIKCCTDQHPKCDFKQCGILTSEDSNEPVQPPFKLRNSKWYSVSSLTVIEYSRQATSKGSDQTAPMRRLISDFAGRTYHIVGNLMSWLKWWNTEWDQTGEFYRVLGSDYPEY